MAVFRLIRPFFFGHNLTILYNFFGPFFDWDALFLSTTVEKVDHSILSVFRLECTVLFGHRFLGRSYFFYFLSNGKVFLFRTSFQLLKSVTFDGNYDLSYHNFSVFLIDRLSVSFFLDWATLSLLAVILNM